jgi:tRNA nucleotidyltransferase (CCA-adding enzyme)
VARACAAAGGRALLVGGGVRDALMGRQVKDWDLEVHGLQPDVVEAALRPLGRVDTVGKAFSVFKLHKHGRELDVSIPRRDSKIGPGHKGIAAHGDPTLTPTEAARRRDLTVNAIMADVLTGEIVDPWNGRRDLADGVLRPVDRDTFLEDPLRALRAVQFLARLSFRPSDELAELCAAAALDELPPERILGEWAKLLLQGRTPGPALAFARRTTVLARVFPEHPHPPSLDDAFDRAVAHRDLLEPEARRLALMVGVWLARLPSDAAEATLDRLRLFRWAGAPCREPALAVARHVDDPTDTDAALRWLSTRAEVELVLRARSALDDVDPGERLARASALGVLVAPPPRLLQGRDLASLGIKPGPAMGALLDRVYALQLDGEVTTPEEARAAALAS